MTGNKTTDSSHATNKPISPTANKKTISPSYKKNGSHDITNKQSICPVKKKTVPAANKKDVSHRANKLTVSSANRKTGPSAIQKIVSATANKQNKQRDETADQQPSQRNYTTSGGKQPKQHQIDCPRPECKRVRKELAELREAYGSLQANYRKIKAEGIYIPVSSNYLTANIHETVVYTLSHFSIYMVAQEKKSDSSQHSCSWLPNLLLQFINYIDLIFS